MSQAVNIHSGEASPYHDSAEQYAPTLQPNEVRESRAKFHITDSALDEAESLSRSGYNVQVVDAPDAYALGEQTQAEADRLIMRLEAMQYESRQDARATSGAAILRDDEILPAVSRWTGHLMHPMALQPTYHPYAETLGDGLGPEVLDAPLFNENNSYGAPATNAGKAMSARDVIRSELDFNERKATKRTQRLEEFGQYLTMPMDSYASLLFRGSRDGAGIRTRAVVYTDIVLEHIAQRIQDGTLSNTIDIASLGCGAATPLYELLQRLNNGNHQIDVRATLVDQDVTALACAYGFAARAGIADRVTIQRRDLLRGSPQEYIPEGADIVDLLGVFEYFTAEQAVQVLQNVAKITRPGGIIVFGNMLDSREQMTFFKDVIRWPGVRPRSVRAMFDIIKAAGFNPADVIVKIPAGPGVYSVYGLKVPQEPTKLPGHAIEQIAA